MLEVLFRPFFVNYRSHDKNFHFCHVTYKLVINLERPFGYGYILEIFYLILSYDKTFCVAIPTLHTIICVHVCLC